MAVLTKQAFAMLVGAGCTEIADDYIVLFNSDVRVLLSNTAVNDLNYQARIMEEFENSEEKKEGV